MDSIRVYFMFYCPAVPRWNHVFMLLLEIIHRMLNYCCFALIQFGYKQRQRHKMNTKAWLSLHDYHLACDRSSGFLMWSGFWKEIRIDCCYCFNNKVKNKISVMNWFLFSNSVVVSTLIHLVRVMETDCGLVWWQQIWPDMVFQA